MCFTRFSRVKRVVLAIVARPQNSQMLRVRRFFKTPQYWSIRRISRQSQRSTRVSEMDMALRRHSRLWRRKKQGVRPQPHPFDPIPSFRFRKLPGHDLTQALLLLAGRFFLRVAGLCRIRCVGLRLCSRGGRVALCFGSRSCRIRFHRGFRCTLGCRRFCHILGSRRTGRRCRWVGCRLARCGSGPRGVARRAFRRWRYSFCATRRTRNSRRDCGYQPGTAAQSGLSSRLQYVRRRYRVGFRLQVWSSMHCGYLYLALWPVRYQ